MTIPFNTLGQLCKVEVHDGDVLCLPADTDFGYAQAFADWLRKEKTDIKFTIVLGDIQSLDEHAMNAAGWYRK